MRTFGIAQLMSSYRKEFNTEITEKGQTTEITEKKKTERVFPAGPGRKKRGNPPLQEARKHD